MEDGAPAAAEGLRPPSRAAQEVSQLLVQLPQARNAAETFGVFAECVQRTFDGVKHISILLLPSSPQAGAGGSGGAAAAPAAATVAAGGPGADAQLRAQQQGKAAARAADAPAGQPGAQRHPGAPPGEPLNGAAAGGRLRALRAGPALDWGTCCLFHLLPGRGPIVQPPPPWPVACTAAFHAATCAGDAVVAGDYAAQGPHFLDWKALAEKGCASMAAVPLCSCNRPVAVLCMASDKPCAFDDAASLRLLAGVLAPYCGTLCYTTRRAEMQRLVNEVITPIAAQLAQQKHSQLARLGCSVEEAPAGTLASGGKGISVAIGGRGGGGGDAGRDAACSAAAGGREPAVAKVQQAAAAARAGGGAQRRKGGGAKAGAAGGAERLVGAGELPRASSAASAAPGGGRRGGADRGISHKRFESVIVRGHGPCAADGGGVPPCPLPGSPSACGSAAAAAAAGAGGGDPDLDWSDFFFNLVSMAIVCVYFSKAAVAGESLVAILLCMGVAAFDIVLLAMRWLWSEHYIQYGGVVMSLFQAYRVAVLPAANTWMSYSLLNKMSVTPSWPMILLLGAMLVACIVMGLQVRFFLHAPLQLASVLFAATSTPDICGAFFDSTSSLRCVGIISAVQLTLGLLLPSAMVYLLEGRSGRAFLPHMQAKRLLHP